MEIQYFPASAPYDPGQGFTIVDTTTRETSYFPANTASADLSAWYPPAMPLSVNISVTRWQDQLELHQANGETFPLTRGNLQGVWSPDPQNNSWFTTYAYFDAQTSARPGLDWWIYDVTTGQASSPNQTDLSAWLGSNTDSDGDGLPDWYEFILGTNPHAWSHGGRRDSGRLESPLRSESSRSQRRRQNCHSGGWTNLQYYQAGLNPNVADSDGNGLPDWWELQNFGHIGVDPKADPDADGLTNLQEFQAGTNPNNRDSDGDGIPDGWEVQHGLNPNDPSDAVLVRPGNQGLTNLQIYQGFRPLTASLTLGRANHAFTLHRSPGATGDYGTLPAISAQIVPAGTVTVAGDYLLAPGSSLQAVFPVAPGPADSWYVSDDTTGECAPLNTTDLRAISWALSIQVGGFPFSTQSQFAIPASRWNHILAIATGTGDTYPLTRGDLIGEQLPNATGGGTHYQSLGFFTAHAEPPGKSRRLHR